MGAEASSVRLFQSVIAFRKKYSFVYSVPQEGTGCDCETETENERDDIDGLLSHLELDPRKWESQREFKKNQKQKQHSIGKLLMSIQ